MKTEVESAQTADADPFEETQLRLEFSLPEIDESGRGKAGPSLDPQNKPLLCNLPLYRQQSLFSITTWFLLALLYLISNPASNFE
jgi:hypothetical protein